MLFLKRSDCVVITLVLTGRWYKMIDEGGKREEYRRVCDHYRTRLSNFEDMVATNKDKTPVVAFSLGYRKPTMWFVVDSVLARSAEVEPVHPEWGEDRIDRFVLRLGERVALSYDK